jgi:hypothetical protein
MDFVIDWENAPKWAKYAVSDSDGEWFFYENKPKPTFGIWYEESGKMTKAKAQCVNWKESLLERP